MDSDEDMQYASEGDDFYGVEYSDALPSDEEDEEYAFDDEDDTSMEEPSRLPQLNYFVMNEEEIWQRQEEAIRSVCGVLSVPRPDAILLLRHFKWCVSTVNEEWFNNEQRIRKSVGLVDRSASLARRQLPKEMRCGICLDVCPSKEMIAAACGHYFCDTCWRGYIHSAIGDGPGCLTLRCPDLNCGAAIGEDMVFKLASKEDRQKYKRYLLRSFVEDNRQAKWCPAPGCEYAVEYYPGGFSHEIVCKCARNFCWNCLEEAHRPVDCETVAKWIMKNSAESENMNWILANSKPCPKCKRPIEKNQGCMHMTCTPPCKFEFCWLCLGPWDQHGERTGGFYACNRYEAAKQEGLYDESDRRREMAKNMLERYTHYYERWATNESSRAKAVQDYQQMQLVQLEKLSDRQCQPASQLKFVSEAWLQIVECRRILKWTYAYGYYLPEQEVAKRQFFEYLQGEAENGLERLHICAEKELQMFLEDEAQPSMSFNEFRTKLAGLTSVTRTYFENLVRALENGLCDVEGSKAATSTKASGSSKSLGNSKTKSKKAGSSRSSNNATNNTTNTNTNSSTGIRSWDESEHWSCTLCTYANVLSARVCDMCHNPRVAAA